MCIRDRASTTKPQEYYDPTDEPRTNYASSKGREFDHVVLPTFGKSAYLEDIRSRRLLYIALTRARKSVTIYVPKSAPSDLLPLVS